MTETQVQFANHIGYSDVNPHEAVRAVSAKTLEVRAMNAEPTPGWTRDVAPGGCRR